MVEARLSLAGARLSLAGARLSLVGARLSLVGARSNMTLWQKGNKLLTWLRGKDFGSFITSFHGIGEKKDFKSGRPHVENYGLNNLSWTWR